jgi:PAS domain S-box-containing protein
VAFIHQIDKPVAVHKGLYLWSGNQSWADLLGVDVHELIGAGIEEFIHPDSLRMFISHDKRRHHGDPSVPDRYQAFLSDKNGRKIGVCLSVSPLIRPSGTWLVVAEMRELNGN